MRQIWKWLAIAGSASAIWTSLLAADLGPAERQVVQLLPLYAIIMLGCYGLAMLGYGVMVFPTCPKESELLQKDIAEARAYFQCHGVSLDGKSKG